MQGKIAETSSIRAHRKVKHPAQEMDRKRHSRAQNAPPQGGEGSLDLDVDCILFKKTSVIFIPHAVLSTDVAVGAYGSEKVVLLRFVNQQTGCGLSLHCIFELRGCCFD